MSIPRGVAPAKELMKQPAIEHWLSVTLIVIEVAPTTLSSRNQEFDRLDRVFMMRSADVWATPPSNMQFEMSHSCPIVRETPWKEHPVMIDRTSTVDAVPITDPAKVQFETSDVP